jgi:hypothetical protein
VEFESLVVPAIGKAEDTQICPFIPGEADQDGHAVESAIDETLRIVNGIDPNAQLTHWNALVLLNLMGVIVERD